MYSAGSLSSPCPDLLQGGWRKLLQPYLLLSPLDWIFSHCVITKGDEREREREPMVTMVTKHEACTGSAAWDLVPLILLACDSLWSRECGSSKGFFFLSLLRPHPQRDKSEIRGGGPAFCVSTSLSVDYDNLSSVRTVILQITTHETPAACWPSEVHHVLWQWQPWKRTRAANEDSRRGKKSSSDHLLSKASHLPAY